MFFANIKMFHVEHSFPEIVESGKPHTIKEKVFHVERSELRMKHAIEESVPHGTLHQNKALISQPHSHYSWRAISPQE